MHYKRKPIKRHEHSYFSVYCSFQTRLTNQMPNQMNKKLVSLHPAKPLASIVSSCPACTCVTSQLRLQVTLCHEWRKLSKQCMETVMWTKQSKQWKRKIYIWFHFSHLYFLINTNRWLTLPELWIPFMTIKKTIAQAANKHKTIHHFNPPLSSIDGDASSVVWYQKYVVGDLHSGSVVFNVSLNGQFAHGNSICKRKEKPRKRLWKKCYSKSKERKQTSTLWKNSSVDSKYNSTFRAVWDIFI